MLDCIKRPRVAGGCQRQTCTYRCREQHAARMGSACVQHSLWEHEACIDQDVAIVHPNKHAIHANLSQAANWEHA